MKNIISITLFLTIIAFSTSIFSQKLDFGVEGCSLNKFHTFEKNKIAKNGRVNYPGDATFDVKYYKLNLNFTFTPNYLKGTVTTKVLIKQNNTDSIFVDLSDTLRVDSVKINSQKIIFKRFNKLLNSNTFAKNKVYIYLDKKYNSGELVTFETYYQGLPKPTNAYTSIVFRINNTTPADTAIYTLSEPYGAYDWWPCKDNPADKADSSDVWITAPKYFHSVSNGVLEQKIENTNGTDTYKWKSRYPIANYLISLSLGKFKVYNSTWEYEPGKTMPVNNYLYARDTTAANLDNLSKTNYMLSLFSEKFGMYPFVKERYGHASFGWGGGMEHQTVSSMGAYSLGLIAHELAHQWFGDEITCNNWQNIWINEGFATYSALIFNENFYGQSNFNAGVINSMNFSKTYNGSIFVQRPNEANQIFSGRSYTKASMVLHMLRKIVGDVTFFNILKTYTSSNLSMSNASTEDFQAICEQVSGQNLAYFFNQWIYGEKYPKYELGWTSTPTGTGTFGLNLNLSQPDNTPSTFFTTETPAFFTMPITLRLTYTDDTKNDISVFNNAQNQSFVLSTDKLVKRIEIDPNVNIIRDTLSFQNQPLALKDAKKEVIPMNIGEFSFALGPNPGKKISKIYLKNALVKMPIEMTVLNQKGIVLQNEKLFLKPNTKEIPLNTSNFADGLYFIQLKTGQQSYIQKLLIQQNNLP